MEIARCHVILPMFVFLTELAEQLEMECTQAHSCLGKETMLSLEGPLLSLLRQLKILL